MTIDLTPYGLGDDAPIGEIEHTDFPTSEALDSMDYDPVTGDLTIDFSSGDEIQLSGVPRQLVEQLRAAPSPGAFFNYYVRGRF